MEIGVGRLLRDVAHSRNRFRQVLGWTFVAFLVVLARPVPWAFWLGAGLCAAGEAVRMWAAGYLHKSRVLETRGPYAFVRHPQYFGNALIAAGMCLASWQLWALALYALFFYLFYVPAIAHEDGKLEHRFGDAWREWRKKTPAVIPIRLPAGNPGLDLKDWTARQCLKNGEPAWLALLTGCVTLVWWFLHWR